MARYSYNPGLTAPGKWSSIDFSDPHLQGAVRIMVRNIRAEADSCAVPDGVSMHRITVKVWDGADVDCLVFSSKAETEAAPSLLYCHGGGFFLPIQPVMIKLAAKFAQQLGVRVYLPEYRILPEYTAPYPFRDCLSILERILDGKGEYLLYGESAGGTLAAGLALWARDHGLRAAKGQCLVYPVMDNRCSRYKSMRLYSEAAWPLKNNLAMWREYLKNGKFGLDDYLIPMQTPDVSNLPAAYIEPQEIDTLRDEALAYAERLRAAGTEVITNIVPGSYHGFDADTENPFVSRIIAKRVETMRHMLQR